MEVIFGAAGKKNMSIHTCMFKVLVFQRLTFLVVGSRLFHYRKKFLINDKDNIFGMTFENEVGSLLRKFGFDTYWPNAPIKIEELKTEITGLKEIQVDIVAKKGKVGLIIEATKQKKNNKEKIRKLLLKLQAIKKVSFQQEKLQKNSQEFQHKIKKNLER